MSVKKQRLKAIIVGGSIGGVSCAKALILAGWDVLVIEKSLAPPTLSPTGAGLALDPLARKIVASWIHQPEPFQKLTLPLTIFQVYLYYSFYVSLERDHKFCLFPVVLFFFNYRIR